MDSKSSNNVIYNLLYDLITRLLPHHRNAIFDFCKLHEGEQIVSFECLVLPNINVW